MNWTQLFAFSDEAGGGRRGVPGMGSGVETTGGGSWSFTCDESPPLCNRYARNVDGNLER